MGCECEYCDGCSLCLGDCIAVWSLYYLVPRTLATDSSSLVHSSDNLVMSGNVGL